MAGGNFLPLILLAFALFWIGIAALIARQSGWSLLAARWPDRDQIPDLSLHWQSGRLGRVGFGNCLRLDACPGGLRIALWRPLCLFQSPFLVPWSEIAVEAQDIPLIGPWPLLVLGHDRAATLRLSPATVTRLGVASPLRWPPA